MKSSSSLFAVLFGVGLLFVAGSNIHCSALQGLLADGGGGVIPGADGGVAGDDGGGTTMAKGSVAVTFNVTSADLNGKTGSIIARVKVCGAGGAVSKSETLASQTLAMGTAITMNIADVDAGSFCLRTYLDVNGNSMQDTGDIIPAVDEVMITVAAGTPTAVTVDLAMIKP